MENKKKILFIEDDRAFQAQLGEYFKRDNFEVFFASDGVEAVSVAEEKEPDIILLDLALPGKDGFETLEDLKKNSRLARIPVLVLTNLEGAYSIERVFSSGAAGYLIKANYTLEEILEKAKEVLVPNRTQ